MDNIYISATGINGIEAVNLNTSHAASMSIISIECISYNVGIGDLIEVYAGYTQNNKKIFKGYVKQITKVVPEGTFNITAYDVMTRAVDYFIVSSNPDNPFRRKNISAEFLVRDVLELAQLTQYTYDPTSFTFGIRNDVEVNLVSAYDFCKMIADLLTWHLFADVYGVVNFVNRKPHVMVAGSPESNQPGFTADTPIKVIDESSILNISHTKSEKDLRNRIVVYGNSGIAATAQSSTSLDPDTQSFVQILPNGYYKTAALATYIIDSNNMAEKTAEYNLKLLNRLSSELSMTVIGDPDLMARRVITVNSQKVGLTNSNFYIYSAEHNITRNGYVVNMLLRK